MQLVTISLKVISWHQKAIGCSAMHRNGIIKKITVRRKILAARAYYTLFCAM